jgi:DnaJ-class molecular chaperone
LNGKVKSAPDLCPSVAAFIDQTAKHFLEGDSLSEDEIKCDACDGSGVQVVKHPSQPGRRTIAPCKKCGGKGRIKVSEK